MAQSVNTANSQFLENCKPLPLTSAQWQAVIDKLELPPQQARVVELVLRGLSDKQIKAVMGISGGTIRTYLTRIFQRTDTSNRVELAVLVLQIALQLPTTAQRHQD